MNKNCGHRTTYNFCSSHPNIHGGENLDVGNCKFGSKMLCWLLSNS